MRKKVLLVSLAMAVSLMSACGKNTEKAYQDQLHTEVDKMATKIESTYGTAIESYGKNCGADVKIALKGLKVYGEEFKDFTVDLTGDTYDKNTKAVATVNYDKQKMVTGEMYLTPNMVYFMLPDYSKTALSSVIEGTTDIKVTDMPKADVIRDQVKEYGKMLADTFKYKSSEKKATFNENDFKFDATVMTGECTGKDLDKTMDNISDKFKKSELYKFLDKYSKMEENYTGKSSLDLEEGKDLLVKNTKVQLKLYDGSNDNMAYEIVDSESEDRIVFVTDGKSWSFYGKEKDKTVFEITNRIEKDGSDLSGYLKFAGEDVLVKVEYTDAKITDKKLSKCNYKLLAGTKESDLVVIAEGKFAKEDKNTTISVKIDNKDIGVAGELEINVTEREAKNFELPKDSIDSTKSNEWAATIDVQKAQSDMMKFQDLIQKFSSIANPYQNDMLY